MAAPLSGADGPHHEALGPELFHEGGRLGLGVDLDLVPVHPEEPRPKLRWEAPRQERLDGPVLLRNEGADLALAVDDQPERDGLDPAGAQSPPGLPPPQRAAP